MNYAIRTFELKINGETRTVFGRDDFGNGTRFTSCTEDGSYLPVALCKFRTGDKFWPTAITWWKQTDGSYKANMQYTHLNRCRTFVVAWADDPRYATKIRK